MALPHTVGSISQVAIAPLLPVGYHQSDDSLAAAVTLTPPAGSNPRYLMMQCTAQNVRYTLTNAAALSTPTPTFGHQMVASDPPIIVPLSGGITVIVIEEAAGAVLQYQWFD
jgi:hypothetical protein